MPVILPFPYEYSPVTFHMSSFQSHALLHGSVPSPTVLENCIWRVSIWANILQKGKQKSPGRATSRSRSQPLTPGGREKVTQINVFIANKTNARWAQRPAPSSPSKVIKMLKGQKKHIEKDQGKTKHEAPRSVNYRATQNKKTSGPPP